MQRGLPHTLKFTLCRQMWTRDASNVFRKPAVGRRCQVYDLWDRGPRAIWQRPIADDHIVLPLKLPSSRCIGDRFYCIIATGADVIFTALCVYCVCVCNNTDVMTSPPLMSDVIAITAHECLAAMFYRRWLLHETTITECRDMGVEKVSKIRAITIYRGR
jgi:hypothetical protein